MEILTAANLNQKFVFKLKLHENIEVPSVVIISDFMVSSQNIKNILNTHTDRHTENENRPGHKLHFLLKIGKILSNGCRSTLGTYYSNQLTVPYYNLLNKYFKTIAAYQKYYFNRVSLNTLEYI